MKAWIARRRRARLPAAVSPKTEINNPLRLDNSEYLQVMKELDEVLAAPLPENSAL